MDEFIKTTSKIYNNFFQTFPKYGSFAPGRGNLIGEHTDYTGGFALPFATSFGTITVGNLIPHDGNDSLSTIITTDLNIPEDERIYHFELTKVKLQGPVEGNNWKNYVLGVFAQYIEHIPEDYKVQLVINSNLPLNIGLSSSASLEVSVASFLEQALHLTIEKIEKAKNCQKAEHQFAKVPCGIMDQFASCLSEENNLLFINFSTLEYKLIPFGSNIEENKDNSPIIIITNSKIKHELSSSEYPIRVTQCNEALKIIQSKYSNIKTIGDVSFDMLLDLKDNLFKEEDNNNDNILNKNLLFQRIDHIISENHRVLLCIDELKQFDYEKVGKLLVESHESLRDKYNVSCEEIDFLVEISLSYEGVYGSRIMGGGFGGSMISLVKRDYKDEFIQRIKRDYQLKYQIDCDCFEILPSNGAYGYNL